MNTAIGRNLPLEMWNRTPRDTTAVGAGGAIANLPPSPASSSETSTETSTETSIKIDASDTFVANDTPEQTQERLNPVFSTLRGNAGLGANVSDLQVLERFRNAVIPEAIDQLNQRIVELEQAEPTPQNQLALDNARASLALYTQANQMLVNTPLLVEPAALSPEAISEIVQTAIISEQTRESYSAEGYDKYRTPLSADTLFNQRKSALDAKIIILADATTSAPPEEAAKYRRVQALLQELSDLYGSFPGYTKNGNEFIQDVERLTQRITSVTQALTAASGDLSESDAAAIDGQLKDFVTLASELAIMPNRPGNLGYSINFTYKRVGEIQAGKRTRETPDISGALASYVNDRKDITVFVSRFGDLRAQIRSGSLRGQAAIDKALFQIPGTSQAFKTVFSQLVRAELEIAEAARLRQSARADVAEGNREATEGEQNVSSARERNQVSRQTGQQARTAADQADFGRARGLNGRAATTQQEGAAYVTQGQANLQAVEALSGRARRKADSADRLDVSAGQRAQQAALSAFASDLQDPIQKTRQAVSRSQSEGVSLQGSVGALEARAADLSTTLAEVRVDNTRLQTENTAGAAYIEKQADAYLAAQDEENTRTLELLESIMLTGGAFRKFEETFLVKLGSGSKVGDSGVTVTGQLKAKLTGEVKPDGSVALDVSLDIGASAELKTFLVDFEGALEVGGSYGLRFSRENAVEFSRLLNNLVTTLGNEGISTNAEQARARLFAFMNANSRSEVRLTASGSGSVGSGNEKSALGAKVQLSRVVQNTSVDSNGDQRFDSRDKVTTRTTYEATLTVDVTLDGYKYSGKILGIYDADTGRVKAPTLTVESFGRPLPAGVVERLIADGKAQGILPVGANSVLTSEALAEAQRTAPQPSGLTRSSQSMSRVAINFDTGDLSYSNATRMNHEKKIDVGANEGKLSGYDETGTTIQGNIYGN